MSDGETPAERGHVFVDGQNISGRLLNLINDYVGGICEVASVSVYNSHSKASAVQIQWCADFGYSYVAVLCKTSKNSVDIKIAVDAIATGFTSPANHFFLATNDSDFTHIASKLISLKKSVHLLYTLNEVPSGYSSVVQTHRIVADPLPDGGAIDEPDSQPAPEPLAQPIIKKSTPPDSFVAARSQSNSVKTTPNQPPVDLTTMRSIVQEILRRSPFHVLSDDLFNAIRAKTGRPWKKTGAKKTANTFLEELRLSDDYTFVQYEGMNANCGFFCASRFAIDEYGDLRNHAGTTFEWALPLIATPNSTVKSVLRGILNVLEDKDELSVNELLLACGISALADKRYYHDVLCMLWIGEALSVKLKDGDEDDSIKLLMAGLRSENATICLKGNSFFGEFCNKYRRGLLWALSEEPTYMLPSSVITNIDMIFNIKPGAIKKMVDEYGSWVSNSVIVAEPQDVV